jgi:SAM-dependent methyltransferase
MSTRYRQDLSKGLFGKYLSAMRFLPPSGSILELGCASGDFSRVLMDRGFEVAGVELDGEAAELARAAGVEVRQMDLALDEFPQAMNARFDAVLAMDVIEHVPEPSRLLRKLRQSLRDPGRVIVTGPNVAYWAVRWALLRGRWQYVEAGILDRDHLRFYTFDTWVELANSCGFDVVRSEACDGFIPLEHRWLKIPLLCRCVPAIKRILMRRYPRLFASQFAFELRARFDSTVSG